MARWFHNALCLIGFIPHLCLIMFFSKFPLATSLSPCLRLGHSRAGTLSNAHFVVIPRLFYMRSACCSQQFNSFVRPYRPWMVYWILNRFKITIFFDIFGAKLGDASQLSTQRKGATSQVLSWCSRNYPLLLDSTLVYCLIYSSLMLCM